MTTYERILDELGSGLGIALAPDADGIAEVAVGNRIVLLRADETGEQQITIFTTVLTAPEGEFPPETLKRALTMSLFGRETGDHQLGLFADTLILSTTVSIPDLTAEALADRLVALAHLADTLSGALAAEGDSVPPSHAPTTGEDNGFMMV